MIDVMERKFEILLSTEPEKPATDSLWNSYFPNEKEKSWTHLGFQRNESPLTDFRGTKSLGLHQLM